MLPPRRLSEPVRPAVAAAPPPAPPPAPRDDAAPLSPLVLSALRALPLVGLIVLATGAMLAGYLIRRPAVNPAAQSLSVCVVNVGNGEAAWLRTPSGRFVLIGGGPPEAGERVVRSLRSAGATEIALLVAPYPYREAIGGLPIIARRLPVRGAWESGYPPPGAAEPVNEWQEQLSELLTRTNVPTQAARAGQSADLGDGVRMEVLAPAEPFLSDTPRPANNSLVVRVTYGQTRFLFAGGLERAGETALLARVAASGDPEEALRSDWLRVARLGTREATSAEFLRQVRPEMAVISVGARNEAGYPHRETLQRLQATGARVWRTDDAKRAGNLLFRSDGSQIIAEDGSTR